MPDLNELLTPRATAIAEERLSAPPKEYPKSQQLKFLGYFSKDDEPYDLTDYPEVRKRTMDNVASAIETRFPLESDKYILALENVHFVDKDYTPRDEKAALLNGKTLGTRLKGDWVLYDKAAGKELERKKDNTLVSVPYLTNRGVFIRNGNEYGLRNMFRLRPGLYTRIKGDGIIATHVNPAQGTGRQSNILLSPTTGVFTWKIGTRNYGLLPLLLDSGKDPEEIKAAWGEELYNTNYKKFANIIEGKSKNEAQEYRELWDDKLSKIVLDKDTTAKTLGTPFETLNGDALLATTGKILRVAQTYTDAETDDRDSLRFQTIMGAADYLPERIVRDGGGMFRKILNNIEKTGNLSAVPTGAFQPHVDSIFQEDRHAGYIDGASPIEALDFTTSISRIGEGGLGTDRAASDESRGVNNSYLGFIDPIRCYARDTELKTKDGWVKVQDLRVEDELACLVDGKLEYCNPIIVHAYTFKGRMYGYSDGVISYLVTDNHRMYVHNGDWFTIEYAEDIHRLAGLGVRIQLDDTTDPLHILKESGFYTEDYNDMVYCPSVPGGLVFCRRSPAERGFWCGNSPESQAVGLQVFATHGAKKDSKGRLWTKVIPKGGNGAPVYADMDTISNGNVATPEYYNPKGDPEEFIPAFRQGGDLEYMPRKDVDFYIADSSRMMSDNTGFIAGIGALRSNRTMLGSKASSQALSLPMREAPLVQRYLPNDDGTDSTTEAYMGRRLGAKFADADGVVTRATDDEVVYRDRSGQKHKIDLYNQLPANNKGWLSQRPLVKEGEVITKGQPLVASNYTDDNGDAAIGVNLKVAMVNGPNAGTTFDAITVSESAAKTKLASEQLYKTRTPIDNETIYDKKRFLHSFDTSDFTKEQLDTIGDDGVVTPGTVLQKGDPMVLAISERSPGVKGVSKKANTPVIKVWEHDYPGTVMDIGRTNHNLSIYTKALTPAKVGDKISTVFGNKGIIGQILPDNEMLQDENGEPFEVYQSPLGLPSRVNPMVLGSLQLGKIAKATGKPIVWKDFSDEPMADTVMRMLGEHGLKESENLLDPSTGKTIPDVSTGYLYYLKFKHMGDSKEKARSTGDYTMEGLPLKGGHESARRFGSMEIGAMVGHTGVDSQLLKDAKLIRGQENHAFWRAVRNGEAVPTPEIPQVHKKFFAHLRAAGVNLEDRGDKIHMYAATEPDIEKFTGGREVVNGGTYDAKELRPISGGIFDPNIFGANGDQWAYYKLPEPILNPLMEKALVSILGWKEKDFQGVLNGEMEVNGKTGPDAVKDLVGSLDLQKEYNKAKEQLKSESMPALKRDKILKRYRAIAGILREHKDIKDMFLTRMPILPPRFRPVSVMGNDVGIVSDANYLYKAMIDAAQDFQEAKEQLPDEMLLDARKNLHTAVKAVIGLVDSPDKKLQEKGVEGVLKWAFGKASPKLGSLHRKVFGATDDLGGLAVAAPDSRLALDEIGLPEESAWSSFEPFVVRNLRFRGYNMSDAMKAVEDRSPAAKQALEEEMDKRPILVNRAPTLHKYNILAFWPKISKGTTIRYNPLVAKGYNVDADGDLMTFHVPVSRKAVEEAKERMLPSKNLLNPATLKAYTGVPMEEFAQGLYIASKPPKGKPVKFASKAEMLQALRAGKITYDTAVEIPETT